LGLEMHWGLGVRTQVGDKAEGVAGGRGEDHEQGEDVFDGVGTEWCAEGAGRGPEAGEGEDALSVLWCHGKVRYGTV
jgi:hypothetical protein